MPSWKRLIRFEAVEGGIHFGEPVDETPLDAAKVESIKAREITGGPFDGKVGTRILTVKKLLSPLESTPLIPCIGLNYRKHAEESGHPIPKYPMLFQKPPTSLAGPFETITLPAFTNDGQMDYEGELCVVIGKGGKNIPLDKALDHVLGYTVGNDISARWWQIKHSGGQFCFGKGMDKFAPIGPLIVSPEVIPDPQKLQLTTKVDGIVRQSESTQDMIFSVPEIISFLSKGTTLLPGTVIMTGTPSGVGLAQKPPVILNEGTVCRVEIEGVGAIENTFTYATDDSYVALS
ncbi:fumarylacetoacetate hydrolase family protein [Gonapodya prolifera JEL478]|uniref:Fumarylacetoacetate hydrolase family protein n=1 Tax=Gonapodya prolifera (strain JEL478) TaxID=1344416 RepID=A0A138ZXC7_GONPJ|nr:fumarylacetoacetate hydrolase family protein [Gonapodya prolifera JEL478]|eukprot:KXS09160.1 fumarylacetoacetate hydrolase family protein [Gonapodya prolifera JEL478]